MATTDWHTHWLPHPLLEALARRTDGPHIDPAWQHLVYPGSRLRLWPAYHDLDVRRAASDAASIDREVLSLPGLFRIDSLPVADALPLLDIFNTETQALVARHPDRYAGLAALPVAEPALAAQQLEKLLTTGPLIGAILPIDGFLDLATAQAWKPVLAVADRYGAHVFLHPGPTSASLQAAPAAAPSDTVPYRRGAHDIQTRITSAAITLAFTPLLDEFPKLTVQLANLGGTLPFILERFDAIDLRDHGRHADRARLRRLYVDTASLGPVAISAAVQVLGADRILLGTDAPIFPSHLPRQGIESIGLDSVALNRLKVGNGLWRNG